MMNHVEQYAPQFSGEEPAHALGTEDHDRKSTDLVQR